MKAAFERVTRAHSAVVEIAFISMVKVVVKLTRLCAVGSLFIGIDGSELKPEEGIYTMLHCMGISRIGNIAQCQIPGLTHYTPDDRLLVAIRHL